MQPKLVLIEGLPGFGKTTTAQLVHDILTEMNIKSQLFLEGNLDHPADYDGVACMEKAEYEVLWNAYEQYRALLSRYTSCRGNHYFVEYRRLLNEYGAGVPNEMMDAFIRKDVYELPLDQNRELIAARWKQFAGNALNGPDTYVFDCCFIQNPVTMGMIKYDAAGEEVAGYINELAAIAEGLHPLLIYVQQNDPGLAFRRAVEERPKEWSDGFIDYYTKQGFGQKHGCIGLEGTLQVLEARMELEKKIYNGLTIAKKKVDNSSYDLKTYKQVLAGILAEYF